MTRLLLVGLAAAGFATAGLAQTAIPGLANPQGGTATQPAPTVTGSGTTQTTVPGVGGATTTGTGTAQVPNQFTMPSGYGQQGVYGQGMYGQQGVYGQPYSTNYPYGYNPYQQGVTTAGYSGMPYSGVMQTGGYDSSVYGGYGQGGWSGGYGQGGGCGCAAPMYQQPVSYAVADDGCCGKKRKRGLFRR